MTENLNRNKISKQKTESHDQPKLTFHGGRISRINTACGIGIHIRGRNLKSMLRFLNNLINKYKDLYFQFSEFYIHKTTGIRTVRTTGYISIFNIMQFLHYSYSFFSAHFINIKYVIFADAIQYLNVPTFTLQCLHFTSFLYCAILMSIVLLGINCKQVLNNSSKTNAASPFTIGYP
jgi:hypothetical protein